MNQPLVGSCLCGAVKYKVKSSPLDVYNCHCSMCRKLHASAFRSCAKLNAADWEVTQGEDSLKEYESSPGEFKMFCGTCGSSLYTRFANRPELVTFPLGTLDTEPAFTPNRHVYVGSKASWFHISDDLPQFEENS